MHFDAGHFRGLRKLGSGLAAGRELGESSVRSESVDDSGIRSLGSGEAWGKIYGGYRSAGSERLKVPMYFPTSYSYFVYVAFLSADGTDQASSVCLGALEVGKV